MDRGQKEYYRHLLCAGRSEKARFPGRLLGPPAATGLTGRNKQKHRLSQALIGGGGITCCPHFDSYIRSTLRDVAAGGAGGDIARAFPRAPERVLDAPGLMDDFYLNILDWGKRNVLAVALGPSLYLWNGKSGSVSELMSLPDDETYVTSVRWIHDGSSLAVGNSSGQVQIWDAESCKRIRTIIGSAEGHRLSSLAWNKHLLSTSSRFGEIATNDVRLAKPLVLQHQTAHVGSEVCGLEWSPDGRQLASGGNDNVVQVWDAGCAAARHTFLEHRSAVKAVAWCPWRPSLLATGGGSHDRHIRTWNTVSGDCVSSVNAEAQVSALTWSKTSRELISAHGQPMNSIKVWRVGSTAQTSCALTKVAGLDEAHSRRILHMTLSPDGQTLVTAGADETIKFWRAFDLPDDKPSGPGGKKKPSTDDKDGFVLMPKFSRSGAIDRALHSANRILM